MGAGKGLILFVEDDPSISEKMSRVLVRSGFEVITAMTVKEARSILERTRPDFAILDLGLADEAQGGFILASEMKTHGNIPYMVYSASGTEENKHLAYMLGADDFQVKGTVSSTEFVDRIDAILRRSHQSAAGGERLRETVEYGSLKIDPLARVASRDGEPILLSKREFDLLLRLVEDEGKVVKREDLMVDVWHWDQDFFGPTKTLDVHIGWLRRKIGDDPNDPKFIHTVRGVGFRFDAPGSESDA
jgi:DNA-binding response OmpR family regulator